MASPLVAGFTYAMDDLKFDLLFPRARVIKLEENYRSLAPVLECANGVIRHNRGRLDKVLPGFGEIFRMLSYEQIGAGAMLSRATAGVMGRTLVFSTPGSTNAVRLAMEKLIVPELAHLVWETVRQS